MLANVSLHHVRQDAGDDDRRKTFYGKATEDDFRGEHHAGDGGVEGGANAGGGPGSNQHLYVSWFESKPLAGGTAQCRTDLHDGAFASDRTTRANTESTGECFHERHFGSDNPIVARHRGDDLGYPVALGFGSEPSS